LSLYVVPQNVRTAQKGPSVVENIKF